MNRTGLVAVLGGRGAELLSQALLLTLLPRVLGAHDFGSYAVLQSLTVLGASVAAVGGPMLMARLVAAAPADERAAVARAIIVAALPWRAGAIAAAVAVGVLATLLDPGAVPPLAVGCGAVTIVLSAAGTWASFAALAIGRLRVWSYRWAVQNGLTGVSVVGGYVAFGVDGALVGLPVGSALGFAWVARGVAHVAAAPAVEPPDGLRAAGALYGVAGLAALVSQRTAVPLVAVVAGATAAGQASVGVGVVLAITFTVNQPFAAATIDGYGRGQQDAEVEAGLSRLAWQALLLGGLASLGAAALAEPLTHAVLGAQFRDAGRVVALGFAAIPLGVLAVTALQVAVVRMELHQRAVASALGAATSIGVTAALAGPVGPEAAAVGLVASTAVVALALWGALRATSTALAAACVVTSATVVAVALLLR